MFGLPQDERVDKGIPFSEVPTRAVGCIRARRDDVRAPNLIWHSTVRTNYGPLDEPLTTNCSNLPPS